mgnify:CR=1 FL=1
MTELITKLSMISDVYDDFILGVINYAKKKPEHVDILLDYINSDEDVMTSDVVKFIMLQPDFHDYGFNIQENVG